MNNDKSGSEPDKPFHSSGYAEVANSGSIGSTSSQTFGQRYSADQNRSIVRKYRDSHIGRGSLRHHSRKGAIDPIVRVDSPIPNSRQAQSAEGSTMKPISTPPTQPRQSFKEPPTRGFNPYS
jgi:hypothetical protein